MADAPLSHIPLSSLRYLEAAVRLGSFDAAAKALNVTPSAVSQHIRRIEDSLGRSLFHRSRNRVIPSNSAIEIARVLEEAFGAIGAALDQADTAPGGNLVRIQLFQTWASRWLVPRLERFTTLYPGISVEFENGGPVVDFSTCKADIALGLSCAQTRGVKSHEILRPTLAPVCSPQLAGRIAATADLMSVPLICSRNRIGEWSRWLEAMGIPNAHQRPVLVFASSNLVYEAALAGAGVALAHIEIVLAELESGRLVRPLPVSFAAEAPFLIFEPEVRNRNNGVNKFRRWLLEEINTLNERTAKYLTSQQKSPMGPNS